MFDVRTVEEFQQKLDGILHSKRIVLALIGALNCLIGLAAIILPYYFLGSIMIMVGYLLLFSGLIKAAQFVLGRSKRGYSVRGIFLIVLHILIDLTIGVILLNATYFSIKVLTWVFGLLFVTDGVLQIIICARATSARVRVSFFIVGGLMALLGVLISFGAVPLNTEWVGLLVGIKLMIFGVTLLYIAAHAKNASPEVYTKVDPADIPKIPGGVYSIYFGYAFHLGVYLNDDEVVDYTEEGVVRVRTWTEFLEGKEPQYWEYPDLPMLPPEQIIEFARSEIGKKYPYNFFTFNCESFAIYCKTCGQTKTSDYAQVRKGMDAVSTSPTLGMLVEFYSRALEYLAFNLGGASGKRISLWLRKSNSLLTFWIFRKKLEKTRPVE